MIRRNVLLGLARLARFRADGLDHFDGSVPAVLNSLAPLLGFALVGTTLMLLRGYFRTALTDLLSEVIVLLAPAVISEPLARAWDRDADWGKFAAALNWCQWTVPVVFFLMLLLSGALVAAGGSEENAVYLAAFGLVAYWLSLQWFLARKALTIRRWHAVLLVMAVNLGTGVLVLVPRLLADGALPA